MEALTKKWKAVLLYWAMSLLLVASAVAQGPGARMYDPKAEVTLSGSVEDVQQQAGQYGWSGTHLMLKADGQAVEAHLGPSSYVNGSGFAFRKGDQVQVVGSKVKMNGKDVLLAREVSKDGKTLILRNAQGVPMWSGARGPKA